LSLLKTLKFKKKEKKLGIRPKTDRLKSSIPIHLQGIKFKTLRGACFVVTSQTKWFKKNKFISG